MKNIRNALVCVRKLVCRQDLLFNSDEKNRKMVGNTPFTSLHITHCRTTKKYTPERAKKLDDIIVRVILCFGPNENTEDIPAFSIPQKKKIRFKHNHVFIHFPKDGPIRIVGNPQRFWLLSFQIENSVINSLLQKSDTTWFDDITTQPSTSSNHVNANIVFNNKSIKKRKRNTYSSCETITLGYIDLKLPQKKGKCDLVFMTHS